MEDRARQDLSAALQQDPCDRAVAGLRAADVDRGLVQAVLATRAMTQEAST